MSASIHYRIVKPTEEYRLPDFGAGSAFRTSLEEAFHLVLPAVFSIRELPMLRAMSAATHMEKNGYAAMVRAIEDEGAIEVWAEY